MALGPEQYKYKGKKYHVAYDYENLSANGEHKLIESNVTQIFFNNSIAFNTFFEFKFSEKFNGQEAGFTVWTSEITNSSMYYNFTFPTMFDWDDFYYDRRNTRVLDSRKIKIGSESHHITNL